jgi:hypothetical protein
VPRWLTWRTSNQEEAKAYKAVRKRNEEQRKAMEAPFSEPDFINLIT